MPRRSPPQRRLAPGLLLGLGLLCTLSAVRSGPVVGESQRVLLVFEEPAPDLLQRMQDDVDLDVRWAESGLVVAAADVARQALWPARAVGLLAARQQLGILRADDRLRLEKSDAFAVDAQRFVATHRLAEVTAHSGAVTLLLAPSGSWPQELLGCHGGLILAPHHIDPRTLLDDGPPRELSAWVTAGARPLSNSAQDVIDAVSRDTLQVYWDALRRNSLGLPADRWAFGSELANVYLPHVQSLMQRLVQGIPGAAVEMQPFDMRRLAPGYPTPPDTLDVTTHNVIARLPGSVPGTGTFVIGAHVDATGSKSPTWSAAVKDGIPIETPGAEDNATGVACVLEMLRTVADAVRVDSIAFAFDVEFVAFSGEEVGGLESGLTGSRHYVAARRAAGTKLLGILNMDMVGSDSLGNNLQIVYNRASTWMVDFLQDAVAQIDPPLDVILTPELDEGLVSDHNSFWFAGIDGLLGSDASSSVVRSYASYHRPSDVGLDVQVARLPEVTRAFLATLLQYDMAASAGPRIVFPPEKLRLRIDVQGQEFAYDPNSPYHTLHPQETRLKAELSVYNLGTTYSDTVRVQLQTQVGSIRRTVLDTLQVAPLTTGERVDFRLDPVPLEYGGDHTLRALVTTRLPGGRDTLQTSSLPYTVVGAGPPGTLVEPILKPNPVRELADAHLVLPTSEDGRLEMRVYTLQGEWIASHSGSFSAADMQAGVPVLDESQVRPSVVSGTYLVHVRWTGTSGSGFEDVLTAVVIQ